MDLLPAPDSLYAAERRLFNIDAEARPRLGVSFSGGGNRAAAFAIGVMRALHEKRVLRNVDVISAVSGGSYALSWYLLQSYYGSSTEPERLAAIHDEMMDPDGRFQTYLQAHAKPFGALDGASFAMLAALAGLFTVAMFNPLRLLAQLMALVPGMKPKLRNQLNAVSAVRANYREGIQRTYQMVPDANGRRAVEPPRRRIAQYAAHLLLSEAPAVTFPMMRDFAQRRLPAFVFNTTVRPPLGEEPLGDRIFEIGSVGFGSNSCGFVNWTATEGLGWDPGIDATLQRESSPFATLRSLNAAPAISGAAISDAALEEGWKKWALVASNFGLEYLVPDPSDERRTLRLSDGGHSENLGAYALLRRRCASILVVDAEFEPTASYTFHGYRRLKSAASRELQAEISVPVIDNQAFSSTNAICRGSVTYGDRSTGDLYYLKLSLERASLENRLADIRSYAAGHPAFPHETTADQYYGPERFRAYTALGYDLALKLPEELCASRSAMEV